MKPPLLILMFTPHIPLLLWLLDRRERKRRANLLRYCPTARRLR
jgi:hypothetical protein